MPPLHRVCISSVLSEFLRNTHQSGRPWASMPLASLAACSALLGGWAGNTGGAAAGADACAAAEVGSAAAGAGGAEGACCDAAGGAEGSACGAAGAGGAACSSSGRGGSRDCRGR
eukprot:1156090-Pelagomonas_calceolata.AAC.11